MKDMAFKMRGNPFKQTKLDTLKKAGKLRAMKTKVCPTCDKMFQIHDDGKGGWLTADYDKHVASHKEDE